MDRCKLDDKLKYEYLMKIVVITCICGLPYLVKYGTLTLVVPRSAAVGITPLFSASQRDVPAGLLFFAAKNGR